MCQWCVEHGEGKKWYLNTKNYITKELFDSKEEIRRVCPTAAFKTYPSEVRKKGAVCDKWLLTCLSFECIGCGKCEEVCRVGAVKIVMA